MARNGSGTYSLPSGNPVVTGTVISSSWANTTLTDIGTALTNSIAKDGQTTPTANLPMGGYKLTGLAAGTTSGDSARYDELISLACRKNKLRNGNFLIKQRDYASGAATSAGQYTLDCWKVTGTGGITWAYSNNKRTVTIPASQTIQQIIRGIELTTGTYVLSWEGTAQGRIAGGSYGTSGAVTASITGGTNTTIEFNTGTVTNVQLELGTIATPYEFRLNELQLCQRSYFRMNSSGTSYSQFGLGWAESSTLATGWIPFPVEMYARPTALDQSGTAGHYGIYNIGSVTVCNSAPTYVATTNVYGGGVSFYVASGLTAGQSLGLVSQLNTLSAYLGWSCDL